jgi:Mor family transcriptional regulator
VSEQEDIRLEDLSEGQQEVAALIGPENFRKLMEVYGGAYLYIPKTDRLERMERNERIRAEFDGYNFRELARKYDLTEITIRSIVSDKVRELRAQPMDGQLSLL